MIRIVTIAIFLAIITDVSKSTAQDVGNVYYNPVRTDDLDLWERAKNRSSKLRNFLGSRYKFGKSIGVIIAIGDYTGEFNDLASPVGDAERMRDFLLNEAGFDIVYVLTDSDVNSTNVRSIMERTVPSIVNPDDRLLIYWSGHGGSIRGNDNRDYGFLALPSGTRDGRISSIYMDEARSWLRRSQARQTLFVIDACYSGLSLQMSGNDATDPAWEQMIGPGDYMLTSSASTQVSYGYEDGSGGVFTSAFIEGAKGLADYNQDGLTTITEIFSYVEGRLASVGGFGFVQTPQYGPIGRQEGRFFFPSKLSNIDNSDEEIHKPVEELGSNLAKSAYEDARLRGTEEALRIVFELYPKSYWGRIASAELEGHGEKYSIGDLGAGKTSTMLGTSFTVYFGYDRYDLVDEAYEVIEEIVKDFNKGNPSDDMMIRLVGYTDSTQNDSYAARISQRRANVVADQLVELGIDRSRLIVAAIGKTESVALDGDGIRNALNRKVVASFIRR